MAANDHKRRPRVTDPRADERRRSLLIKIGATVVVVVIAVAIGVWLIVTKKDDSSSAASSAGPVASGTSGTSSTPSVVSDTGAYRVNKVAQPKATLTILEDFQCPACKQFESIFGEAIKQIRGNAAVAVDYEPIAILDRMSSTKYSTRAANASACVAEATAGGGDWSTWLGYHDELYAQQPEEQSSGLTDEQLTSIATDAGAPASVSKCVDGGQYSGWVTAQTQKAVQNGLQGTPQVELNGKAVELSTPQALIAAVDAAVA
ncbi:thioredoxin domain-containing protein [Williamsia sp.]|uniref:DsbA family protein n=1 Tax=Williamsia sp. TaxID=1872085 RepID=UPI001A1AF184|nr:thioredoxin domain-containing protein [Williamsia sp.]MBJ7289729.1 DsbA family protein [Williamsia sp.]